jgi:hypothetical protein
LDFLSTLRRIDAAPGQCIVKSRPTLAFSLSRTSFETFHKKLLVTEDLNLRSQLVD